MPQNSPFLVEHSIAIPMSHVFCTELSLISWQASHTSPHIANEAFFFGILLVFLLMLPSPSVYGSTSGQNFIALLFC